MQWVGTARREFVSTTQRKAGIIMKNTSPVHKESRILLADLCNQLCGSSFCTEICAGYRATPVPYHGYSMIIVGPESWEQD